MDTDPGLSHLPWRKSSYSSDQSGECVECAALNGAAWRKSSYSGDTGGSCVEVAPLTAAIAVRDSKDPGRGHLTFPAPAFAAFVRGVQDTYEG